MPGKKIAYLCTDLLFTSKIRETARALGHDAVAVRDAGDLDASVFIVDLRRPDALGALERLRADGRDVSAIGFCDHERTDLMDAARRAGCDVVLAKGKFSTELKHLLAG